MSENSRFIFRVVAICLAASLGLILLLPFIARGLEKWFEFAECVGHPLCFHREPCIQFSQ